MPFIRSCFDLSFRTSFYLRFVFQHQILSRLSTRTLLRNNRNISHPLLSWGRLFLSGLFSVPSLESPLNSIFLSNVKYCLLFLHIVSLQITLTLHAMYFFLVIYPVLICPVFSYFLSCTPIIAIFFAIVEFCLACLCVSSLQIRITVLSKYMVKK